jgi:septum formation protein
MKRLVLASSSKGRLSVLKKLHITPDEILSPDVDESHLKKEKPRDLSIRLAKIKAFEVLRLLKQRDNFNEIKNNTLILAGDTVACRGLIILEKAANDADVERYLRLLSDRNCRVYSSFCIIDVANENFVLKTVETRIKVKKLSENEIKLYVNMQEGIGKAGGFTVDGFGESFVQQMVGSYSNVIGLPSLQVSNCLKSFGYKIHNNIIFTS